MLVALLICFLVLGIALDVVSVWMKMSVNKSLPEEGRLSWWSRNYRQVNQVYREQNPDSVLPDLNQYGGYLVMALFAALILVGILSRG